MAVDNDVYKLTSATGINPDALVRSQAVQLKREKVVQLQRAINEVSGALCVRVCLISHVERVGPCSSQPNTSASKAS